MIMSIQAPDSFGKVREIFQFWAVFRHSAYDCAKLTLELFLLVKEPGSKLDHISKSVVLLLVLYFQLTKAID